MAEIALAATILKLVASAGSIAVDLWGFGSALGNAGLEVCLMASDVECISSSLRFLANILDKEGNHQPEAKDIAERHIYLCERLLTDSKGVIEHLRPLVEERKHWWNLNLDKRLKWMFKRTKFLLHRESVESLKSSLNLLVSSMNYSEIKKRPNYATLQASLQFDMNSAIAQAGGLTTNPSQRVLLAASRPQHLLLKDVDDIAGSTDSVGSSEVDQEYRYEQGPRNNISMSASTDSIQSAHAERAADEQNIPDQSDTSSVAETIDLTSASVTGNSTPRALNTQEDVPDYVEAEDITEAFTLMADIRALKREVLVLASQIRDESLASLQIAKRGIPKVLWVCTTFEDFVFARGVLEETILRSDSVQVHGRIGSNGIIIVRDYLKKSRPKDPETIDGEPIGLVVVVGAGRDVMVRKQGESRRAVAVVIGQDTYVSSYNNAVHNQSSARWPDLIVENFKSEMILNGTTGHELMSRNLFMPPDPFRARSETDYDDFQIDIQGTFLVPDDNGSVTRYRKMVDENKHRTWISTDIGYAVPRNMPHLVVCGIPDGSAPIDVQRKRAAFITKALLSSFDVAGAARSGV